VIGEEAREVLWLPRAAPAILGTGVLPLRFVVAPEAPQEIAGARRTRPEAAWAFPDR
jgi:hypothetical protein